MKKGTASERTGPCNELVSLSDPELVTEVGRRAAHERHATAALIRALIEFDRRRLYLGEGYASLFAYCTQALHYSEHAAFNRIEVARAAARWPQVLACIEDGSLHLAGARLLAPHLTEENLEMALASARHKSKREIEEVAAGLARRAVLVAVAAEQYRLHLTISRAARDQLRQVQALLSHQLPDGNPAVIFEQALGLLLTHLERQRLGATARPRPAPLRGSGSRHIPAAVRREVWKRDEGRCAFVGHQGRCAERHFLEFHHVIPYAAGGEATAANIEVRCRAHNAYEARAYSARTPALVNGGSASPGRETPRSQLLDQAETEHKAAARSGEADTVGNSPRGELRAASRSGRSRPADSSSSVPGRRLVTAARSTDGSTTTGIAESERRTDRSPARRTIAGGTSRFGKQPDGL